MTVHETRVDCALALNGWVVFCSCGNLTGFADDAAGADKIAAEHVAKHAVDVVAVVYQDQNGSWDARNSGNEIISVGGADDPQPRKGERLDDFIDRRTAGETRA